MKRCHIRLALHQTKLRAQRDAAAGTVKLTLSVVVDLVINYLNPGHSVGNAEY